MAVPALEDAVPLGIAIYALTSWLQYGILQKTSGSSYATLDAFTTAVSDLSTYLTDNGGANIVTQLNLTDLMVSSDASKTIVDGYAA